MSSDQFTTKRFAVSSNGKVRSPLCPYVKDDTRLVELTATEYYRSRRCFCSHCWGRQPGTRFVSARAWDMSDE